MKKVFVFAALLAVSLVVSPLLAAALSKTFVVTPSSPVFDANHVVAVEFDGAPGFGTGSFKSDGVDKTDMYWTPENLFGRPVTIAEIASVSYWTKKDATHEVKPVDWAGLIYTKSYDGDVSTPTWYGDRIGFEPYFAGQIDDPANAWNRWSSDPGKNQLKFYESTQGAIGSTFGSYTDPDFATFKASNALSGSPYAEHEVLFFSIQTGSSTAAGFEGQVDGLRIELTTGEVANINLEKFITQPANRDSCKQNGFLSVFRANGTSFASQGECVSYINTGK